MTLTETLQRSDVATNHSSSLFSPCGCASGHTRQTRAAAEPATGKEKKGKSIMQKLRCGTLRQTEKKTYADLHCRNPKKVCCRRQSPSRVVLESCNQGCLRPRR